MLQFIGVLSIAAAVSTLLRGEASVSAPFLIESSTSFYMVMMTNGTGQTCLCPGVAKITTIVVCCKGDALRAAGGWPVSQKIYDQSCMFMVTPYQAQIACTRSPTFVGVSGGCCCGENCDMTIGSGVEHAV